MVVYNPKDWFKAIFQVHKSDTFRKLFPFIILVSICSYGIAYYELEYLKLNEKSWVKNITSIHSLLGFVLSLLLVFRTNTAYDRWWEARKQWGTLTNTSRTLSIKINGILEKDDDENRKFFRRVIPMYANSLIGFLKSDYSTYMLDLKNHPEIDVETKHVPNQVSALIYKKTSNLYKEKLITDAELITLNDELQNLTNICGACERIKNTPIPYSYSSFIKKFIFLYVISMPFGFVFSMGYFVVIAVPFIFYVLASLELIAEAIEDPFGDDYDDLPIDKIAENIDKHVKEIIRL